jgi:di/tricarboxylate transporter
MMFMLNTSLSLQIIALVAAAFLLSWGLHKKGEGTRVAKFFGFIATVIALLSLVCSLYFTVKFWQEGRMMQHGMHPMPHEMQNQENPASVPIDNKNPPVKRE